MQAAEFAVTQGNYHEPAFNWWVMHVLKKREIKIARDRKMQIRCLKKSHKFGIELPKAMEHAFAPILTMAIPYGQMQYLRN